MGDVPRAWRPGDVVHVHPFGKGTIVEARNGGRYLVHIKGRAMVVRGAEMSRVDAGALAATSGTTDGRISLDDASGDGLAASLDLHGKTVQEAVDALDVFLNGALLRGVPQVRVIHGRSGGRVRAAVQARLREVSSVRGFRLDPDNPGVTIVML